MERVWAVTRDHLPEIAELQDDIEYVKVTKRERDKKKPHLTHVISTWRADPPLPALLKGLIKPDMLIWTDEAAWDDNTNTCEFNIITNYKVEDIRCVGSIQFESVSAGKQTKITYSGELTIRKTSKSSILMTGFIIRAIESLAGTIIEHNFAKTVKNIADAAKAKKK